MKESKTHEQIVIYQSKNQTIQLDVRVNKDTVWLTQNQMTQLFGRERTVITKHINNIFREGELSENSNVQNMHFAHSDKPVKTYSLDVVISVGYRVKSLEGTRFRQWATEVLKQHILKGYTINAARIQVNYTQFIEAVENIKALWSDDFQIGKDNLFELITLFADTWFSLDAYDKDQLLARGINKKKVLLTAEKLKKALIAFKQKLIERSEASNIFGVERAEGSISGIVGNVMQSFDGKEVYPTVEEKAAHLLYFLIKNHPFIDGNKRSGAYAFVWFLQETKMLDVNHITPAALTALTLLIAESSPKDKDKMIGLICSVLARRSSSK